MITIFERLFGLSVTHAYYAGACRDFTFTIPPDTERLLARGRLLAKVIDDELVVAYEARETAPSETEPRARITNEVLRFGLVLTNPYFQHYTVVPPIKPGEIRVYENSGVTATIGAPETLVLASPKFTFTFTRATRPMTASIVRDGVTIRTEKLDDDDDREEHTFDLRGLAPGRFDVRESFNGGGSHTTACYLDPHSQARGVFAVVEITITPGFYDAPRTLRIAYEARQETLKYYVVVSNYTDPDFTALKISDAGFSADGRDEIKFERVEAADFDEDDDIPPGTLTASGGKAVLFRSRAAVARRERGNKKLQLKKNADILIENLPQPGSVSASADLVVHLFKPK